MTTIRELMGRITQGEWRTHSDETLTVRDKNDGCVFSIGWLMSRHSGPRRSQAEATANATAAVAIPQLLALAAAVEEYEEALSRKPAPDDVTADEWTRQALAALEAKDAALSALQAKLEDK